jgi:hypothetical protein
MGSCNLYIRRAQEQGRCRLPLHWLVHLPNYLICPSRCSKRLVSSSQPALIIRSIKNMISSSSLLLLVRVTGYEKCISDKLQLSFIIIFTSFQVPTVIPSHSQSRYPTNFTLIPNRVDQYICSLGCFCLCNTSDLGRTSSWKGGS